MRLCWMANPFLSQNLPGFGRGNEDDCGLETYHKAKANSAWFGMTGQPDPASGEGSQRGRFQSLYVWLYFLGMGGYAAYS
jgi:hypothetical protein